jgi:hypothetical protein
MVYRIINGKHIQPYSDKEESKGMLWKGKNQKEKAGMTRGRKLLCVAHSFFRSRDDLDVPSGQ